ncbi:MAG: flagellar M-ring protein FliF [Oscillospiraceae bacterium]|nr:flagellar M-ring protein FliF [Oscillospiraceae bacterium]
MAEKIKVYWGKTKEVLGKVSKKVWISLAVVLIAIAACVAYVVAENSEYTVLFSDLNNSDVQSIVSYLDGNGITSYRLEGGNTILVPKSQADYLKMQLILQDYGTSGFAYEYYSESVGALSTESERERAWLISLEQKLRACIITLDSVKDAQVNLVPGEDSTYVLDSKNKVDASASVIVTMHDGKLLSDKEAAAIRHLVARGVQGLTVESVSITDSMGNLYTADSAADISSDSSSLKLQLEEKYNSLTRTNIMQVLQPLFGSENVKVSVTSTVDVNRVTESATDVILPEWATNGEGIIGSKIYENVITRNEGENAGGIAGTTTNSDLPTYVEEQIEPDGSESNISTSGQVDYDNSRKETHTERTAGYLTDCMVSVSINSDGTGLDTEALRLHIARAAGIADEQAASKISIYAAPFYVAPVVEPDPTDTLPVPEWVIYAAAGGLLLFIILLIIILSSMRKRRKKKLEEEMRLAEMEGQQNQNAIGIEDLLANVQAPVEMDTGADVMHIKSERSMELRKDIRKFADESPEIAAQVVRNLLRGGEGDG